MAHCILCNQSWPKGEYGYSNGQVERQSQARGAKSKAEEGIRDIKHLLKSAQRMVIESMAENLIRGGTL